MNLEVCSFITAEVLKPFHGVRLGDPKDLTNLLSKLIHNRLVNKLWKKLEENNAYSYTTKECQSLLNWIGYIVRIYLTVIKSLVMQLIIWLLLYNDPLNTLAPSFLRILCCDLATFYSYLINFFCKGLTPFEY